MHLVHSVTVDDAVAVHSHVPHTCLYLYTQTNNYCCIRLAFLRESLSISLHMDTIRDIPASFPTFVYFALVH